MYLSGSHFRTLKGARLQDFSIHHWTLDIDEVVNSLFWSRSCFFFKELIRLTGWPCFFFFFGSKKFQWGSGNINLKFRSFPASRKKNPSYTEGSQNLGWLGVLRSWKPQSFKAPDIWKIVPEIMSHPKVYNPPKDTTRGLHFFSWLAGHFCFGQCYGWCVWEPLGSFCFAIDIDIDIHVRVYLKKRIPVKMLELEQKDL